MDPSFINKEKIASLLPMKECVEIMEEMFRALSSGQCVQPLRTIMWLPNRVGLLGMMPGHSEALGVMGIKVISVFHSNRNLGLPSHQGVVILFDAKHGQPLMIFDAAEITAIRTAAASAVATRLLSRENSKLLAIIGSGEQAERHIEAISLVRKLKQVNIWSRNEDHSAELAEKISNRVSLAVSIEKTAQDASRNADIICTVTSSQQPVIHRDWISDGAHINAVGSSTAVSRELDSSTIVRSVLFTDCYESLFNEAGDFLIPQKEGAVTENHVRGEIGEVLLGRKKGRQSDEEITVFKSLGIAAEDIFAAWHIYQKVNKDKG